MAHYGAIPALAQALEGMRGDEDARSHVAKALRFLSRHDQLDSHAVRAARSAILVDNRWGNVPPDPVAAANRLEMHSHGVMHKLAEIVDTSSHPALVRHATATLHHLENRDIDPTSQREQASRWDAKRPSLSTV
jgi:hypothetical protein